MSMKTQPVSTDEYEDSASLYRWVWRQPVSTDEYEDSVFFFLPFFLAEYEDTGSLFQLSINIWTVSSDELKNTVSICCDQNTQMLKWKIRKY